MAENREAESIPDERIEFAVILRLIDGPILADLFWTKDQHAIVAKFIVFDDCKGFECLTQADAISDDAAIVSVDLVDGTFDRVLLKLE